MPTTLQNLFEGQMFLHPFLLYLLNLILQSTRIENSLFNKSSWKFWNMIGVVSTKVNWLISRRLGEWMTSTRSSASQEGDGSSRETMIEVTYLYQIDDTFNGWRHHKNWWIHLPHKPVEKPKATGDHKANRVEKLTGPTWPYLVLTNIHVRKYLAHHTQRPYHAPISPPYGKTS